MNFVEHGLLQARKLFIIFTIPRFIRPSENNRNIMSKPINRFGPEIAIITLLTCFYTNSVQSCRADSLTSNRQINRTAKPTSFDQSTVSETNTNIPSTNKNVLPNKHALHSNTALSNLPIKDKTDEATREQKILTVTDVEEMLRGRFSFRSEYLLWSFQGNPGPPPLVTAGSWEDTIPGALGQPHTQVLVGGRSLNSAPHSGGRFSIGYQIDPKLGLGVEATYFFQGQKTATQQAQTSGLPGDAQLAVPFFDVTGVAGRNGVPGPSVYILGGPLPGSFAGLSGGQIPGFAATYKLNITSQLQGAETNYRYALGVWNGFEMEGLIGGRWLELTEKLTFVGTGLAMPQATPATDFVDEFNNKNDFFGGQVGLRSTYRIGRFSAEATGRLALGDMHEQAMINGAVATNTGTLFLETKNTLGQLFKGGVFTQPSNIGNYHRDVFAIVPELRYDLGFDLTPNMRMLLGYTFLWASSVARPGNQVDPRINITQTNLAALSRATVGTGGSPIPFPQPQGAPAPAGPLAPTFGFRDSSFWAQGLNFGISGSF